MNFPAIFRVTCHTAHVGPGSVFVAIPGFSVDGADFIEEAIKKGASRIIADQTSLKAQRYAEMYSHIPFEFVTHPRRELAVRAAAAYGHPAKKLSLIGVTGTKGKTTTTFLIHHILSTAGLKVALLGSVKNSRGVHEELSTRATMGADYLHHFFSKCVEEGFSHVAIEVSSHALELDRTWGLEFDAAVFTNLAAEHLDIHGTIENYFAAKSRLFGQLKAGGTAVMNIDNYWGKLLCSSLEGRASLNVRAFGGAEAQHYMVPSMQGSFNNYNATAAVLVCESLGVPKVQIMDALKSFKGVPGRLQMHLLKSGARGFVDHAHEPYSFETTLGELRKQTDLLIVVFGCGQGRVYKRAEMGRIAAHYADVVILTDDNPRFDDPAAIIQDIRSGIAHENQHKIRVIHDRAAALKEAVTLSTPTSIVAVLGKGHETCQVIKDRVIPWSDYEELCKH